MKLAEQYLKKWAQVLKKTDFTEKLSNETYLGYLGDTKEIIKYLTELRERDFSKPFL